MRNVTVNESVTVYFDIRAADNLTPALLEAGGQPQISINGASFTNTGIGVLVHIGYGQYYATLASSAVTTVDDIIQTRYKSSATAETRGDSFQVVSGEENTVPIQLISVSCYSTIGEADLYFNDRLRSTSWTDETAANKIKALRHSTRLIDRLNFAGEKAEDGQVLQFPRKNVFTTGSDEVAENTVTTLDTSVPNDIKIACYEIALKLLEGYDPDQDIESIGKVAHNYGLSRAQYDPTIVQEHIRAGIPSPTAWTYLRPYLRSGRDVDILRV